MIAISIEIHFSYDINTSDISVTYYTQEIYNTLHVSLLVEQDTHWPPRAIYWQRFLQKATVFFFPLFGVINAFSLLCLCTLCSSQTSFLPLFSGVLILTLQFPSKYLSHIDSLISSAAICPHMSQLFTHVPVSKNDFKVFMVGSSF